MLFRSRNNVISSAFHRGFSKRGGGACSVYRQRASIRGGGGSLEGENESVWWSEKEKEKERGSSGEERHDTRESERERKRKKILKNSSILLQ